MFGQQFLLLMWKNCLLRKRHFITTAFEVILPLLFIIILVCLLHVAGYGLHVRPEGGNLQDEVIYSSEDPLDTCQETFKSWSVEDFAYTPNNDITEEIMHRSIAKCRLNLTDVNATGFDTEEDMVLHFTNITAVDLHEKSHDSYGVVFTNIAKGDSHLPDSLQYKLRIAYSFDTAYLYSPLAIPGPRQYEPYNYSNFWPWQAAIDQAFLDMAQERKNLPIKDIQIKLRRFPFPPYSYTYDIYGIMDILPHLFAFGLIVLLPVLVKRVVDDKANRAKEMMKMMGMSDWVYWGSTFTVNFLLAFFISAFITILLKCPISGGASVIIYTDGFIFFLTMLLYCAASILFCLLISTFFNRPVIAVIVTVVIWTTHHALYFAFSFLPIQGHTLMMMSKGRKVLFCFLPNGALQLAIRLMSMMEGLKVGIQWSDLGSDTPLNVSLGLIWGALILACIIYSVLIWYVSAVWPWQYGIPKPYYFPFTKSYWLGLQPKDSEYHELEDRPHAEYFEDDIVGETPGIVISHLTKVYKSKIKTTMAVNNVSLNCPNGQITALLGDNGAGKTTVMNVVTGLFPPTGGTVSINGHDVVKETESARRSLGLCPQHNVLYDTLTVEEHLKFFAGLKGVRRSQIDSEVSYVLSHLKLEDDKSKMTKQLSGGVKRRLCLGIAVIGGSEVLILDEPTAGMDPEARRTAWNLLQHIRNTRTIFLTTHYMEEADALGNRIAIMLNGNIQCCGSPLFLKRKFGSGYHLKVIKEEHCVVPKVTEIVERHLPEAKLESDINKELTYSLVSSDASKFGPMFEELETLRKRLGIETCAVTVTTMEDVFLKIGKAPEFAINGQDNETFNSTTIQVSKADHDEILLEPSSVRVKGLQRHIQQIKGLFLKRFHYTKRHWILIVPHVIIPFLVLCMLLWVDTFYIRNLIVQENPPLRLDLKSPFGNSIGFYNYSSGKESSLFANQYYKNELRKAGVSVTEESDPNNYLLQVAKESFLTYITKYFVGGTIEEFPNGSLAVDAWFNGEPLHIGAMSLNLMDSALLKYVTGNPDASIETTNEPLRLTENFFLVKEITIMSVISAMLCAIFIPLTVCSMVGGFALYPIHERASKSKLLQRMSGVHSATLWLSSFMWDFMLHCVSCVFILIPFAMFDKEFFFAGGSDFIGTVLFLLIMFGWCCIPFSYLLSFAWKKVSTGFALLTVTAVITGIIPSVILVPFEHGVDSGAHSALIAASVFHLFPSFALTWGTASAIWTARKNSVCDVLAPKYLEHICPSLKPNNPAMLCCKDHCTDNCFEKDPIFTASSRCGWSALLMFFYGILYFGLLCVLETKHSRMFLYRIKLALQRGFRRLKQTSSDTPILSEQDDSDVLAEEQRVKDLNASGSQKDEAMMVMQLSRTFGFLKPLYAVKNLTFAVHKEECFGLLGVNGAGKTTTFRMLTGDLCSTEGTAEIDRYNIRQHLHRFRSFIGYCPQYDALLDRLTGEEMLYLFARLRGIPEDQIASSVRQLIRAVDLEKHADKETRTYSGGSKRKLSLAIALMGTPPLIFLDEPTSGVDPVARRKIWSTLMRAKEVNGCSIVLTSHSMEECEALCSRIAIMVNGRFQCLGTTEHLKSKFGQGYTIIAKLPGVHGADHEADDVKRLQNFIERSFRGSVLKDVYQGTVHYHVTESKVPWSHLFTKMEEAKNMFQLEDYLISGTTLEQIFLSFARKQRPAKGVGYCNGAAV